MGFKKRCRNDGTRKNLQANELFNVKIESETENSVTAKFASDLFLACSEIKVQLIQWIPIKANLRTEVVMRDASVTEGFAEADCKKLKPDEHTV